MEGGRAEASGGIERGREGANEGGKLQGRYPEEGTGRVIFFPINAPGSVIFFPINAPGMGRLKLFHLVDYS